MANQEDNNGGDVGLQNLSSGTSKSPDLAPKEDGQVRSSQELEPVFDVPVRVQAVLGKSTLEVSQLLKLAPGAVIELDRKVGEAIDIYVNNRLVARGEVVLVEDHLGVTMTEIIKLDGGIV
ncbi:flagellar motor switch protein FliN [Kordiimonas aestuarii]|uniref:flagellar motor switch protein FliN n=1 Tax=Kordiimonas aestuarii TaxID=1005925 RepID=UPI0021CEFA85|nr:flagellar motor switch protein FliN [Kordiimonas aestuarii]